MNTRALTSVLALLSAGCANTAVETTRTFYPPATLVDPKPAPTSPQVSAKPIPTRPQTDGVSAIKRGKKLAEVRPIGEEIEGNTWVVPDIDPRRTYVVYAAPLQPTTLLFPEGDSLTSGDFGSKEEIQAATGNTGARASATLQPTCARPGSRKFGAGSTVYLTPCMASRYPMTAVTTGGVVSLVLEVTDTTAIPVVEFNRAPPPRTTEDLGVPPPNGPTTPLKIDDRGSSVPWKPVSAYADATKTVVEFTPNLPYRPALFAGQSGEQTVSYSWIEAGGKLYAVTGQRVTEAEFRHGHEIVRLGATQ